MKPAENLSSNVQKGCRQVGPETDSRGRRLTGRLKVTVPEAPEKGRKDQN